MTSTYPPAYDRPAGRGGQTPATDTARTARRAGHHRSAARADAQGAAWEDTERQKDRWWR